MRNHIFLFLLILPPGLGLAGENITAPDEWRRCSKHSECLVVDDLCSRCCGSYGIRKDAQRKYSERFITECAKWSGGVCDCVPAKTEARCVKTLCEAVPVR